MRALLIIALALLSLPSLAATKITLNCEAPTTRVDGSIFAASDVGSYLFDIVSPAVQSLGAAPTCSYTVNIAAGTCIKAGTVFSARVSDTLGVTSDPGTATLAADACNPKAKPSAPTVTITVQ